MSDYVCANCGHSYDVHPDGLCQKHDCLCSYYVAKAVEESVYVSEFDNSVKVRMELVPWGFVIEMARVAMEGLQTQPGRPARNANDWQHIDSDEVAQDKRGALLRHYGNGEWAAVAFNAAILWWHEQRSK